MAEKKRFLEIDYPDDDDGCVSIFFSDKGIWLLLLDDEWNELVNEITDSIKKAG